MIESEKISKNRNLAGTLVNEKPGKLKIISIPGIFSPNANKMEINPSKYHLRLGLFSLNRNMPKIDNRRMIAPGYILVSAFPSKNGKKRLRRSVKDNEKIRLSLVVRFFLVDNDTY